MGRTVCTMIDEIAKGERGEPAVARRKIQLVARRNTRLKRREADWFPRVLCSLLDARYRWNERAEILRRGLGSGWKAMRNLSEMTSARPSSSAKGLIPEESCIVWREKGSRFSLLSFFLSSSFFFLSFFSFPSLRPPWHGTLVRVTRKALAPHHFRWWPPTATYYTKPRSIPRTNMDN